MCKTILVVDDEADIVNVISYNLQKEGYRVISARNGKEALEQIMDQPALVLLDVMMPEMDGWEVLKEMKQHPPTAGIPVIFLTAKGTDVDEVLGLTLGADDYIVKPVSMVKLIARIQHTLRRQDTSISSRSVDGAVTVGAVEIIPSKHLVRIDGAEVMFPRKEFNVLLFLARRAGQLVSREVLLSSVWGTDIRVVDRSVDVYIWKVREKLGRHAALIQTIKGVGYRMREG
jgi:two-component system alkaline phosphatase synthesis response regulator PhoP